MIKECEYILSLLKYSATSYKPLLLLYIIKNTNYNKKSFTFDELANGIVVEAWKYIEGRREGFNRVDAIYNLIKDIIKDSNDELSVFSNEEEIIDFIASDKCSLKTRIKKLCNYVPYRLLEDEELRKELAGLDDWKKNNMIADMSNRVTLLYRIEYKTIYVHDKYISTIIGNRKSLISEIERNIEGRFCNDIS